MSNVNIIVDTKLQPNNNLCIIQIKENRCTSNERTDQTNKPIEFWYLLQCRAMKAQVSMCICVGRLARAFAAGIHKVVWWLMAKF